MNNKKSFFLYIHDDISGEPDWVKCGKSMTPYSAVRLRQRIMVKKFHLNDLYFGDPNDIDTLENGIKTMFSNVSGKALLGTAATEVYKTSAQSIKQQVEWLIKHLGLRVIKVQLDEPYSAANSGSCPFNLPSEHKSHDYLTDLVHQYFDLKQPIIFKEEELSQVVETVDEITVDTTAQLTTEVNSATISTWQKVKNFFFKRV